MEIHQLLRNGRKNARLTQAQVAAHVGLSVQAVSQWEKGKTQPELSNLLTLAALYRIPLQDFVGEDRLLFSKRPSEEIVTGGYALQISWSDIGAVATRKLDLDDVNPIGSALTLTRHVKSNCLSLLIEDESMFPIFRIGDIIIISLQMLPEPGDFVVMSSDPGGKAILRRHGLKLLEFPKRRHVVSLKAFSPDYPEILVDPLDPKDASMTLCGVVIEHRRLRPTDRPWQA